VIDVGTFGFALFTLMAVRVPRPLTSTAPNPPPRAPILKEDLLYGWAYLGTQPGLLAVVVLFAVINTCISLTHPLQVPLILSLASATVLGSVLTASAVGSLIGSLVIGAWGGPAQPRRGALGFSVLLGGCMALVGVRPSIPLIVIGLFGVSCTAPMVSACLETIMQTGTPPEALGRVLASASFVVRLCTPLAYLAAGPLVEVVIGPWLTAETPMATLVHGLLGGGPSRGMGAVFVMAGLLTLTFAAAGCFNKRVWRAAVPAAYQLSRSGTVG
jgi:hypothetical protein